jgi:hypothetical protein
MSFLRSQLDASQKKRMRWSVQMKLFCLQLHYKSPSAYRFMCQTFTLPTAETLVKFVNGSVGRMQPGFSSTMFNIIRLRVKDLSVWDRQCSLVFDEISLKSELTYNKYFDRIIGFTENGHVGTHALVFMVRGLFVCLFVCFIVNGNKQLHLFSRTTL